MSEKSGNFARIATYSLNLGIIHFRLGEWTLATREFSRSLEISTQIGNRAGAMRNKLAMANVSLRMREWSSAESTYRDVLATSRELVLKREECLALEFLGELQLTRGDSEGALELLKQAEVLATEIAPNGDLVMEVVRRTGDAHLLRGEIDDAMTAAARAAEIAGCLGDRCEEALARRITGSVCGRETNGRKDWISLRESFRRSTASVKGLRSRGLFLFLGKRLSPGFPVVP